MKKALLLNWGTYPDETLFYFGAWSGKQIVADLKKRKLTSKLIKNFKEIHDEDCSGYFSQLTPSGSIIWIKSNKLTKETICTIVHELHHALHARLIMVRGMNEENEALAYQLEYLLSQVFKGLK